MQDYTNPKSSQVVNVKGNVYINDSEKSQVKVGDSIEAGSILTLEKGSEILLAFADGTEQRVSNELNDMANEVSVDTTSPSEASELSDNNDVNDIQNEIAEIQELIDSESDVELPETAAGLANNEGSSFVSLNRTGDETLAQAGYDTTEQNNANVLPNNFNASNDNDEFSVVNNGNLTDDDESVTVAEDNSISGNVLDNAASADGPLTVSSFSIEGTTYNVGDSVTLAAGEFTLNADGSYTFTPNDNFNGVVPVVTYTVIDGAGDTDVSTLSINVTPSSDLTDADEAVTIAEDTAVSGNVLGNAASVDGPLTVTSFSVDGNTYAAGDTVTLAEGELTLNADGSYSFTPNDNFNGVVPVVTYTVIDGAGDTDVSTLSINVTPSSDLTDADEAVTIAEDTAVSGNVLGNAASVDGPLTVTSFSVDGNTYAAGDTVTLAEGELTLNADGSYSFTPNDNFNGVVPVVTYTVIDGAGDTDVSTLSINVTPSSDLTDADEAVTIAEDTAVSGNVLGNAASVDGPLTVTSFSVDGNTYAAGDTVTLAEGELTLNADGSYSFTPNDNFNGAVPVISYTVTDGAGDTTESTLTINVTPVSDLSDTNETVTVAEDTRATGNVLDNAMTADGPLSVTSFTVGTTTYAIGDTVTLAEGELTLNVDGSYSFTPNDNFNGSVPAITYTVTDGAGDTTESTLTINVTPVSDLSDTNETVTVAEDTLTTGNVLDNATTADGPLSVTSFTVGTTTYAVGDTVTLAEGELTLNADGTYSFTPNDNFNGAVPVITYTVTDGAGDTDTSTLTINVTPVSDLTDSNETVTVAEDTLTTGNVLDNATTADGPLSVTSFTVSTTTYAVGDTVTLAEGELTLNADGTYSFTPNDNFNGAVPVITYTVTDGAGDTDTSTLTINVTPVSDLTDNNETVTVAEDTLATGNVLDNAASADSPLTVTSFTVDGNTYAHGDTVTLAEGELSLNADGSYSFTPNDNFNGAVPVISYTVTDGAGDTTESSLTINVTPVSDLSDNNETVTVAEDSLAIGNVLDNATTADGPLTVTSFTVGTTTHAAGDTVTLIEGELTLNADGSYSFTPNDNFNGAVPAISYTVTDGAGDTTESTLTINVTPVSDLSDTNEVVTIAEDTPATGNVLDNATTADGPLSVTSFTVGTTTYAAGDTVTLVEGELTLNVDGSYSFTPNDNFNGTVPVITYTVTDGAGDTTESTLTISVTPVSDLSDNNEVVTVAEDTTATGNVLDNAATADGPLTVTSFTVGTTTYDAGDTVTLTEGELTLNVDGSYSFTPNDNFNGSVPAITYTVTDGAGDTTASTLTINVTPVSDLSDNNEVVTVAEDTTATGNVLDNAATADGPLTVTSFTVGTTAYAAGDTVTLTEGELTLNADGRYTFTPNDNFNGTVPVITYTVTDGAGDTTESTLTINVTPVSDLTDNYEVVTIAEDTTAIGNVLDNAATADGPLTVTSFTVGTTTYAAGDTVTLTEGELTLNVDGSYSFTPNDNFNGSVPAITYTVTDGAGDTTESTLTINVTPVSDLTDNNETITVAEDTLATGNVLDNAASADIPLTVTSFTVDGNTYTVGDTVTLAEGELTLNADGSYSFTPNDNFNGSVPAITYTVTDGAGDTTDSSLTINVTPVSDLSDNNETVTVAEDTPATGNVLDNAATADGPLTVTSFIVGTTTYAAGDTVTLTEGKLTLNVDGSYSFTPNDNFNGSVPAITYTVTDGAGDTTESTLTINVTPVSDLSDNNETITITEDTPATGNVLDNATSADGPVTVTSFTVAGNTYTVGDTVTLAEGELTLNADGSYSFTPNDNFNGAVPVISYTVADGAGDTNTSTLTINVTPVSDLSDNNEVVTVAEDTPATGNVLDNAATADGPLSVTSFTVAGNTYAPGDTVTLAEGELTLNVDGSYSFTPNDNFNGSVPAITYTVTDGAGDTTDSSLTINVTPVSDLSDNNETVTVAEDTPATGNVLDNAATADGPLTVTSFIVGTTTYAAGDTVTLTEGKLTLNVDGSYSFTPNDNFNGSVPAITYTVTDGAGDTTDSSLTINVTPVSDLSDNNETVTVAEDTPATGNVLDNAATADGPLTVTSFIVGTTTYAAGDTVTLTEGKLTLNVDGSYSFTPNDNFNGSVPAITYTVTDGAGDTTDSSLTINVTPVSDLSDNNETVTVAEDTPATGNVLDNAATADGPLTVTSFIVGTTTYAAGDTVTLTEGKLTLNVDGSYSFTPNDNFNGSVPAITYTVTDGAGDTTESTLTINVTPVSDLSDNNETITITEDTPATGNVLDNATSADGPVTVTSFTVAGNTYTVGDTVTLAEGELTLNADGSYSFTPNDNFNGAVPVISYTVADGAGDTNTSTLTINVTPVSDLSDNNEVVTVAEDTTATGNVLDNAATADGPLTVTSFTVGTTTYAAGDTVTLTEGELTLNVDGSYSFTPNDNFNGTVPVITYTVTDGAGDTTESTLTISVTPVSDLSDNNEVVTVAEDTTATGNVLDNAATADGPLTVTSFTVGTTTYDAGDTVTLTEGELTLNVDGSYSFTPNDNFNGSVPAITYTVTDGAGDTTASTLTINVTPVSDLSDNNEVVTVAEDTTATGNVLDNAATADGPLTVTSFTVGTTAYAAGDTVTLTEGELTLNADGSYTFTPNDNFNGTVPVITYTVTDGAGDTTDSSLTINVTPVSDLTDNNETVIIAEDTLATGNVLDNAATVDGPIKVTSFTVDGDTYTVGDTVTLAEGELTLNADGTYSFTPNDNFNGTVPVIRYTVTDAAGDTDTSTLTITVTPESDLSDGDEAVSIAEDTIATGNVLANAATVDGPISVTSFTIDGTTIYTAGDTVTLTEGELTLNADGTYSFTPNDNFNGTVPVITYTVTDAAGDTDTSTLTITVTPESDLIDGDEAVAIAEDTIATGNVLANAATVDGPVTVTDFTVDGNTYTAGDTVTLTEGELTLNADGTYRFTPNDNFNGTVPVITYTVTDAPGDTDTSTLTITVTPESDLSDGDEAVSIAEDTIATGNVLANAATVDGPISVTSFTIDGTTIYTAGDTVTLAEGELTLNADGTYSFTPNDNFNGTVPVITYTVTDAPGDTDTSTLTITVTPESDLSDGDEAVSIAEDTIATGNVLANAATVDGPISVTSFTIDGTTIYTAGDTVTLAEGELTLNADGTYSFTPNDNFNGTVPAITYTVTDAAGDTDTSTLTITVTPESDLSDGDEAVSIAEDTIATGNVLANAATVDGPISVTSFTIDGTTIYTAGDTVTLTEGELTLNADGTYSFTPNDNFNGTVPVITYTVTDAAGDTDTSTLTITVTPESDLSDGDEAVSIAEDTIATGNVLANAATVDGPISVTSFTIDGTTIYTAGDTVTLAEGELTLNADGTYRFTPNDNFNGTVPVITYTVTDAAGDTDTSTLTIDVTPVNDPPVAADDSFSVNEGSTVSGNIITHHDGDGVVDTDGGDGSTLFVTQINGVDLVFDPLTGEARVEIKEGFILIKADGSFTYTHNGNNPAGASPSFSYTLSDGTDVDTGNVTIAVTPVNDPPIAADDDFNIDEGESVSGNVITHNDGDAITDNDGGDGSILAVTHINGIELVFDANDSGFATISVDGGILRINVEGDFTYQNSEGFVLGADYPSFEYTVSDGSDSDTANVIISINDTAPIAYDDNNSIVFKDRGGFTSRKAIKGNVMQGGSSGDNEDNPVEGTISLIQFEYAGTVYIFDANHTSHSINTGFGTFVMYNTGRYEYSLPRGIDVNTIPPSIEIIYTIQDDDIANPETDDATLTINFSSSNSQNIVTTPFSDGELIDINDDLNSINLSTNDESTNPEIEYDLSDLLVANNSNDLNENFMPNELVEGDASNLEPPLEVVTAPTDDNLILASVDPVDGSSETETIITNNFLAEGVTLNSDASSEVVPLPIELDSTDQI